MSPSYKKWIDTYKHLELDAKAIEIYQEKYISTYGDSIDSFRAMYFQTIVDINMEVLKAGDEVYYVFGKGLSKGVVDYIMPYRVGYTEARIRIKGKKKLVDSFAIAKI